MSSYEPLLLSASDDQGFLNGLDPHHIHKLAALALEARFAPGQAIFHQGDQKNRLYVICRGMVALKSGVEGPSVQVLQRGAVLGWSALLEGDHRHFEALCMSEVHALAFDGEELLKLFEADPRLGYAVMKRLIVVLAGRLESARNRTIVASGDFNCKLRKELRA